MMSTFENPALRLLQLTPFDSSTIDPDPVDAPHTFAGHIAKGKLSDLESHYCDIKGLYGTAHYLYIIVDVLYTGKCWDC